MGRPLSDPALGRPLTSTERAAKSRKRLYVRVNPDDKVGGLAVIKHVERFDHIFVLSSAEHADEDFAALVWLTESIDKLSRASPMRAYNWSTHRGTKFIVFGVNGVLEEGAESVWSDLSAQKASEAVFGHVAAYRRTFNGPVDLVWRRDAELDRSERGIRMTVRLCFEPTLVQVAKGVWVESRLAQMDPNTEWG